jgi:hypothetical protein
LYLGIKRLSGMAQTSELLVDTVAKLKASKPVIPSLDRGRASALFPDSLAISNSLAAQKGKDLASSLASSSSVG